MIPTPKKYIADFENLGFGLFIHWGLYSQLGQGEWIFNVHKLDKNEYMKLQQSFTAEDFNAEEIALMAKNAGMKYITLTTRHHEGFSHYDTCGLNTYDAPHSPAGRDLIREFVDACNKYDIVLFFYHTTLDWIDERFENDFDAYLEYLRQSVEILCKNYGKIGGLWFDGNWSKLGADWKEDALYATIRKYQPEAIIVNNTGLLGRGVVGNPELDVLTFEQGRPTPINREGHTKYLAAEMCETINNHWGIGKHDLNYKSVGEVIETLCACRKVGANYLLNIGPTAQGGINSMDKAMLELIGRWTNTYGEAIYNTKPCEIKGEGKNFVLKADEQTYYAFIHNLLIGGDVNVTVEGVNVTVEGAADGLKNFYGFNKPVKSINWLDNNEELQFMQDTAMEALSIHATRYKYGSDMVVRVAKIKI